jgi:hypothetical protein
MKGGRGERKYCTSISMSKGISFDSRRYQSCKVIMRGSRTWCDGMLSGGWNGFVKSRRNR